MAGSDMKRQAFVPSGLRTVDGERRRHERPKTRAHVRADNQHPVPVLLVSRSASILGRRSSLEQLTELAAG